MSHEIIELLSEINAKGTTVIVVTHEHDLVREFSRRVVLIDHGRIKSDIGNNDNNEYSAEEYSVVPDYPENAVVIPD